MLSNRELNMAGMYRLSASKMCVGGATTAIFSVSGGKIIIYQIIGKVIFTGFGEGTNLKLVANPTVGADDDLCATVDRSAAYDVDTLLSITGTFADAMVKAGDPTVSAIPMQSKPFIVQVGDISTVLVGDRSDTIIWTMYWLPLDPLAVAAVA